MPQELDNFMKVVKSIIAESNHFSPDLEDTSKQQAHREQYSRAQNALNEKEKAKLSACGFPDADMITDQGMVVLNNKRMELGAALAEAAQTFSRPTTISSEQQLLAIVKDLTDRQFEQRADYKSGGYRAKIVEYTEQFAKLDTPTQQAFITAGFPIKEEMNKIIFGKNAEYKKLLPEERKDVIRALLNKATNNLQAIQPPYSVKGVIATGERKFPHEEIDLPIKNSKGRQTIKGIKSKKER